MIFEDSTRRRWKWAVSLGAVAGIAALAIATCIATGIVSSPRLPVIRPVSDDNLPVQREVADAVGPGEGAAQAQAGGVAKQAGNCVRAVGTPLLNKAWVASAFVVQGDPRSVADLEKRRGQLDIVFPDWYSFQTSRGELVRKVDPRVRQLLAGGGAAIVPRLSNTDLTGAWHGDDASEMLKDWDARPKLIASLVAALQSDHAAGVNIDIEGLEPGDKENLLEWLSDLGKALQEKKLVLTVDVPLNDEAFDYEAIGKLADAVVVMGYDEHFPTGAKGAIAGKSWFNDGIAEMVGRVPAQKLLVALGGYGYDWNLSRKKPADALGFDEVMVLADRNQADVETDEATLNSRFSYSEDNGDRHEVWFLDAVSAWNQMLELRKLGVRGASLWRLGLEEPALWTFLSLQSPNDFDPHRLTAVAQRQVIDSEGRGEFLKVARSPADGRRDLYFDGRSVGHAVYQALPRCYSLERFGHEPAKRVALTFDDGPDPVWTPEILKVLGNHGVQGTFFVVGDQAERFPQIVRRAYDEGHLIGNHTFSHPNFETVSDSRQEMELNLTQRVIESITGHSTALFRSPFDVDTSPDRSSVLRGLANVSRLGYVIVGAEVDSEDYLRPGVDGIVENVMARLQQTGSNIVLMHDAGGDRGQTVQALDRLIVQLRAKGYELVGLDELMGVPHTAVMPALSPTERAITVSGSLLVWMRTWGWKILETMFLLATSIAILRILFVGYFAVTLRSRSRAAVGFHPPVAVIVPAFNEAKVIRRTLETLLESDYPQLRVIVIDDGSTDGTADIVAEMAGRYPQIRLIRKENAGKHSALNLGFLEASEEFVVTIDADTLVLPQTVSRLIEPLVDPGVDAVCGNVQVGNVKNLLTAFQDVEYVTSQNYDRRAFDSLNCISVVPGATGAWRRATVLKVGGYSVETLTEDADLTLSILEIGGRIVYAPEARSITEAPESPQPLFKQRFRWSFGTLQCLWKHRRQLGHGTRGCVAIPNMLIFQVIFPLLSPVGDLVFLWSLLRGEFGAVAAGYCTFVLLDLLASLVAFRLDRRPMSRLIVVLLQRLYYRQFMYLVTFKAVLAAIRGGRHGWNKLERRATLLAETDRNPETEDTRVMVPVEVGSENPI